MKFENRKDVRNKLREIIKKWGRTW